LETASISCTQVREEYLNNGQKLASWFNRLEVAEILAESYQPWHKQGACVWFGGLSGGRQIDDRGGADRHVTILDGDMLLAHLSRSHGFDREDRDTDIHHIDLEEVDLSDYIDHHDTYS